MDEVPYQYDILDDLDNLHKYLMDLTVFSYLDKVENTVLGTYWHRLIEKGRYSLEEYLPLVDNLTENQMLYYEAYRKGNKTFFVK